MSRFSALALSAVTTLGFAVSASADSLDRAGSLLLFPLFDNNRGGLYTITVTNTNSDTNPLPTGQLLAGTIDVEFVYINGYDCLEFNRTRRLTPNDTITVTTLQDNPNQAEGYCYVFAKSPISGKAIKFDWLAGDSFHVAPGLLGGVDLPPVVFKASSGVAPGTNTDNDNDGLRDLDEREYEQVSDELLVPRFLADNGNSHPQLILIGLTGKSFTTIINFLIYNDNEEVFSAQRAFDCWDRVDLKDVNGAFTDSFLRTTNHAVAEYFLPVGGPVMIAPPPPIEYGWFRMDGATAFSTAASVSDPAFLAMRLERLENSDVAGASLPYGIGMQDNGDLIQHGPFPDAN